MATKWYYAGSNLHLADDSYSPQQGKTLWENFPQQAIESDPAAGYVDFNDFMEYVAASFTITAVGTSPIAQVNEAGGVITITTGGTEDNGDNIQRLGESWKLTTGKPCWFEVRVKVDEVIQSDLLVGLCITDTDLLGGMTDGVYFRKVDGSAVVEFVTEKDSTETATAAVHTLVNDTYVRYGFRFNGAGTVQAFVNGVLVATHTTNIPDDEELRISLHFLTGEAGAKVCRWDYYKCGQVR